MTTKKELGLVLLAFALVAALSFVFQKPLTYHDGQGWDGVSYVQMAHQIASHQRPSAIGPFAFRLGTPWLVALLFPQDLLLGFRMVNQAACILATVLLVFWLRRFVKHPWIRLALVIAFLTQWHAPLRFTAHYAAYTDPWLFVFLLAVLLALPSTPPAYPTSGAPATRVPSGRPSVSAFRGRRGGGMGVILLCFLGALFRESVLVVPLAAFLASRGKAWLPLAAGALGVGLTHFLAHQSDGYSFARTVGQWAYNKPLPVYVHGLFIAFGPALVLSLVFWRTALAWLKEQPTLAWTLVGFLILGWVGGSDTERIVYWAMPVVYPLLGVILEKHTLPREFLFALAACQLLSHRIFWTLPDYPGPYPDLWSYQARRVVQVTGLAVHLTATALLAYWLQRTRRSE